MLRICRKCQKSLPLENFPKAVGKLGGHRSDCKICISSYHRQYYLKHRKKAKAQNRRRYLLNRKEISLQQKEYRKRNLEKRRAYGRKKSREEKSLARVRKWHKTHLSERRVNSKKWRLKNKDKIRAHTIVATAIKSGKLKRLPCLICGNPKSHAHHVDYGKPLEVKWLCSKHHFEEHRTYV